MKTVVTIRDVNGRIVDFDLSKLDSADGLDVNIRDVALIAAENPKAQTVIIYINLKEG